ncbi:MAG: divalent-cation tolerance protein CutA [Gammaproteobacteria bacterium]
MSDFSVENQPVDAVLVMTTLPDNERSEALARSLIAGGHVACVHCSPRGTSIYRWNGEVETAREVTMVIKTVREHSAIVMQQVHDEHPYELPELLVVPVIGGSAKYLDWIASESRVGTLI